MADFGEYLPFDSILKSNSIPAASYHNEFPFLWSETTTLSDSEALFFHRSTSMKSPGATRLHWMGDQMTTFDAYDGLV